MKFFTASASTDLVRIQADLEKAFDKIEPFTLSEPKLLTGQVIRVTDTPCFHGLGRPPKGWIIVRRSALATDCEGATSTNPSLFVNLKASLQFTATILFF